MLVGALLWVTVLFQTSVSVPLIKLRVSDDLPSSVSPAECPYLVSLPASDALCVAADHLAESNGFALVQFHLVRDAHSQHLAILGCADAACSGLPLALPEASSPSLLSPSTGASAAAASAVPWSCCSAGISASVSPFPRALLSSVELPPACYRVQCVGEAAAANSAGPQFLPWRPGQQLGEDWQWAGDLTILEFLQWKFARSTPSERVVFSLLAVLFGYLTLRGYWTLRRRQTAGQGGGGGRTAEEVAQPFEVALSPGEEDSVEFYEWQLAGDVETFNRKLVELKHRVTKLPFAHAHSDAGREGEGFSVVFLGRNVDEPKLVFRNPRIEREQRANIPPFSQAVRNAVVASVVRDTPGFKAYVPRAVLGKWNNVEGVFQEFVPMAKSVSLQDFRDNPAMALDLALLVLLLRDTDAHEGNYARDPRRKIALFDLGCVLADRPLPPFDRECLDNFELLRLLPSLLDVPFEDRHREFLSNIDFDKARSMWTHFQYDGYLVNRTANAASAFRPRASSSVFPLSGMSSPRGHSSQVASPKSTRSLPSGDFFPGAGWEAPDESQTQARLPEVMDMLRVLEMHRTFLLRCARSEKTLLFAAKVLYGGFYDDTWLELGGTRDEIEALERELLRVAAAPGTQAPCAEIQCIEELATAVNDSGSDEAKDLLALQ